MFIGARLQGLGWLRLLHFSLLCARRVGSWIPLLVALRVVPRVRPLPGREAGPVWHLPPTWAPRALGALAVGIALWGVFSPRPQPLYGAPSPEQTVLDEVITDWLSREGGIIAVPMPSKRLERQQAPPCLAPPGGQVEINGGCWFVVMAKPPCGQLYEHEGRCYVPVRETPKPPTAVDP